MYRLARRLLAFGAGTLVTLMPFHAFLVIWLGHRFGHQASFQSWKEVLILLMTLAALVVWWGEPHRFRRLHPAVNWLALAYVGVALAASAAAGVVGTRAWWFGIKTDLVFVWLFLIVQLVSSLRLRQWLLRALIASTSLVSTLALLQVWVLPKDFLVRFGYNQTTIAPVQLIDPAIKSVRVFATTGGPNQLGAFLILPICYIIAAAVKRLRWWHLPVLAIDVLALVHTYSRSAWIGAIVGALVTLFLCLSVRASKTALIIVLTLVIATGLVGWYSLRHNSRLEYYLLHSSARDTGLVTSDSQHIKAIKNGMERVRSNPAGLGLGAAGPASQYGSQAFIPENYYLQIALETGLAGLAVFLMWQLAVATRLWRLRHITSAKALLGTLVGISVVNLFLHGWADSTLALVYWTLAGVVVASTKKDHVEAN